MYLKNPKKSWKEDQEQIQIKMCLLAWILAIKIHIMEE